MTDISEMIRWNANFVRGLAQSVLERAKSIRSTLAPYTSELRPLETKPAKRGGAKSSSKPMKKVAKKTIAPRKAAPKRGKKPVHAH